ncbi:MAG: LmeA family phospholipid-binding protein [Chloroflexota bacterium]|nr:LmeA family phospholipid-binding protein [Chloroflexota bacterium]MDE3194213.1 LmeA family phospholipid-binding protein [Chloroflexota bacterium]
MGAAAKFVIGLVLLVGIAGGGLFVLSQQQPTVAAGLKKVPVTAEAAKSFDDKVKALEQAAAAAKASGKSAPVTATFSEEELTSAANAASSSASGGVAATDTQIHLSGGNVIATSNVTVQGISVPVGVVATPTVVNGQVQMVVQQVQTGALALPDSIKQQIQAQVGQAISPSALGIPMNVSNLQIQNGQLVLSGTTQP